MAKFARTLNFYKEEEKMLKFFKKNKNEINKEKYKIAFCDDNDLNTKFGEYNNIFDTYELADHVIRMSWRKRREDKINDGYEIDDAWLVIEKIVDK